MAAPASPGHHGIPRLLVEGALATREEGDSAVERTGGDLDAAWSGASRTVSCWTPVGKFY